MVYLYGDVPYLTEGIKPNDAVGIARTDKNEILNTLVNELTTAANNLPLSYSGADLGRATQGAALALKTRVLLYQGKWQEAATTAKAIMDLGQYSLYPDYKQLFSYSAINNEEVIFDLQEMAEKQWNFTLQNYGPNSVYGWSSGTPLQSIVDAYECTDGQTIDNSPLYDPTNPFENRDPRLAASILYPGNDWMGGVFNSIPGASYPGKEIIPGDDLTDGTGGQWNKTFTGYNWSKYMDDAKDFYDGNMWNGALHLILNQVCRCTTNVCRS
ncbi:MAG: RagB/SusD family nutrient uptake outer membrane protein [Chloroflexia bacterium]|nr:RagB/SusD family nutrient uptake outer membrane protein [Chloroflexia bacterium]